MKYEINKNGERTIYRTYNDTEVSELSTNIECPYCNSEWSEERMSTCGETYTITCGEYLRGEGCGKTFKMYFDAS